MIIIIIVSGDLQELLINNLRKQKSIHFTFFSPVFGKGSSGIRFGKDFAPGENSLFLIDTSDSDEIAAVRTIVDEIREKKKPKQGVHAIFMPFTG